MRKGEKLYYYFLEKYGLPTNNVGPSSLVLGDKELSHIILELFQMRDSDFDMIVEPHPDPQENELKCILCGVITWFSSESAIKFALDTAVDHDEETNEPRYVCDTCQMTARGSGW